jgi:hypothetical protein
MGDSGAERPQPKRPASRRKRPNVGGSSGGNPGGSGTSVQVASPNLYASSGGFGGIFPTFPLLLAGGDSGPYATGGATAAGLVITAGSGNGIVAGVNPPITFSGTLRVGAELLVSNADGTETIDVSTAFPPGISLTENTSYYFAAADWTIDHQVGSDLSIDTDGTIISAAGGTFSATLSLALDTSGMT